MDELKLKIGARVMLISNIDVADLLSNGSVGTVLGVEEGQNGNITAVIVKFDNPDVVDKVAPVSVLIVLKEIPLERDAFIQLR